jgi:hypothetical protein
MHRTNEDKKLVGGTAIVDLRDSENSTLMTDSDRDMKKKIKISKINYNMDDINQYDNKPNKKHQMTGGGYSSNMCIEGLVLLVVYIVMSQDMSKNFVSRYVYDVTSGSMLGILIYGVILVGVFLILRKLAIQLYGEEY